MGFPGTTTRSGTHGEWSHNSKDKTTAAKARKRRTEDRKWDGKYTSVSIASAASLWMYLALDQLAPRHVAIRTA